jgi:hypothetical protein
VHRVAEDRQFFGRPQLNHFSRAIRPHVRAELRLAQQAQARGESEVAFHHLERAHILALATTVEHVLVHWRMLLWGVRQRSARECIGQVLRILAAVAVTAIGVAPSGNTGGSNVSAVKRMPVPPDLQALLERARSSAG